MRLCPVFADPVTFILAFVLSLSHLVALSIMK